VRLLALVGLPGCGKSTIGRWLSRELDRPFWDLDRTIEERLGCTIADYFAKAGEAQFREVESQILDELTHMAHGVLSTGGGSVLHPLNRQRLRERGQVIYLHATPIQLFPRLRHDKKRPLLQVADPFQKLIELFDARDALYRETAHQVIPSGGRPSRWVLEQCLQLLDHPAHPKASA
jgi:shikimate kinase